MPEDLRAFLPLMPLALLPFAAVAALVSHNLWQERIRRRRKLTSNVLDHVENLLVELQSDLPTWDLMSEVNLVRAANGKRPYNSEQWLKCLIEAEKS